MEITKTKIVKDKGSYNRFTLQPFCLKELEYLFGFDADELDKLFNVRFSQYTPYGQISNCLDTEKCNKLFIRRYVKLFPRFEHNHFCFTLDPCICRKDGTIAHIVHFPTIENVFECLKPEYQKRFIYNFDIFCESK